MALTRRGVLIGGLGLLGSIALVATDVVPGPSAIALRVRGAGARVNGSFLSRARLGVRTDYTLALPPGHDAAGLPLCVALHGKGGSHNDLTEIGYDRALADAVRSAGTPPFALVGVDGGNRYWHRRAAGDDSGAMVTDELLPLLAREHGLACGPADTVAFLGWSMGGYGSLLLASRLGPRRTAAVAAVSPALWRRPGDSAPGAFDDREDYERNDVWKQRALLARVPLRIDCGTSDPFVAATKAFVSGLDPPPEGAISPGAHNQAYWRAAAPAQIAFLGKHLSQAAQR